MDQQGYPNDAMEFGDWFHLLASLIARVHEDKTGSEAAVPDSTQNQSASDETLLKAPSNDHNPMLEDDSCRVSRNDLKN